MSSRFWTFLQSEADAVTNALRTPRDAFSLPCSELVLGRRKRVCQSPRILKNIGLFASMVRLRSTVKNWAYPKKTEQAIVRRAFM